jgi:hypothetical protein
MRSDNRQPGRQPARRRVQVTVVIFAALAAMAISVIGAEVAVAAGAPTATTNAASNLTSTSATLNATVLPNKNATTYYFQYGTTTGYGAKTATLGPVKGNAGKSVSADVTGLTPSTTYHFRVVAMNSAGTAFGSDAMFRTAASGVPPPHAVTISSTPGSVTFGQATTIAGKVSGTGNVGVKVTLEANPYPYTGGFKPTALTATTTATGAYSLAVTPSVNTQYLVSAKTKPPVTSPQTAVAVRVKVTLRVSTRTPTFGQLVTFSGTVTPAHNGKLAQIQKRTSTGAWTTVASATLVAAAPVNGIAISAFSKQLRLSRNATYRVSVNPGDGNAAGTSAQIAVAVSVKVTLRLSTLTPAIGQLVRFSGTVTPAHNGKLAQIQKRTSTGAWTTVASATLVAAAPVNGIAISKFSKQLRISRNATYRVRVNPGDANATGTSPTRTLRVH